MSEIESIIIQCAICGTDSIQNISLSLDTPGYFDLDLRPPYLTSDALDCQIQQCPKCYYCAPMISKTEPKIKNLIKNEEYQKILSDTDTPDLVKKYYAWAYCANEIEKHRESFIASQKGSWVCDDKKELKMASVLRERAIDQMKKCKDNGDLIWDQPAIFDLVLANLYRRTANFEKGIEAVHQGFPKIQDNVLKSAFEFTYKLIMQCDTLSYSFGDVLKGREYTDNYRIYKINLNKTDKS